MEQEIAIKLDDATLSGTLAIPKSSTGIVVFAHGSGSSRFSLRNVFVAKKLQKAGIATLLIDLLTKDEDEVYETRFRIEFLAKRLASIVQWVEQEPQTKHLAVGLFGASTGAGAALQVAAKLGKSIAALVSRGGRPDLAARALDKVAYPTLLIVGGDDKTVLELNKEALAGLFCEKKLAIIPRATHLFEEPGALEKVADLARHWFCAHFSPQNQPMKTFLKR